MEKESQDGWLFGDKVYFYFDIILGSDFLDLTAKANTMLVKINKWDDTKFKGFYTAKDTISKM